MSEVKHIDVQQLSEWLTSGEAILIDVREANEFSERRIPHAMSMPLTNFESYLPNIEGEKRKVVFQCAGGKRSEMAVEAALKKFGDSVEIYNLTGGIDAWAAKGFNVIRAQEGTATLPIMRQVQIGAGSMVAFSSILALSGLKIGAFVTLFIGCGLTFAGLTGWCGMALLLQKMPWNKK